MGDVDTRRKNPDYFVFGRGGADDPRCLSCQIRHCFVVSSFSNLLLSNNFMISIKHDY
jgi:hypothetical protein